MVLPYGLPDYAQTYIGYAIYYLQKGKTTEETAERMMLHKEFGTVPPGMLASSILAAQEAIEDLARTKLAPGTEQISRIVGTLPEGISRVGFRVLANVQFQDGHIEQVSVKINAPPEAVKSQILNMAANLINAGRLPSKTGRAYPVTVVGDPEIYQVIVGGYMEAFKL